MTEMTMPAQPIGAAGDLDRAYDAIVLGAGPVGQNAAARARAAGLSVAIVERELVGGECSYWGCIPSKSLLRPVIAPADACRVEGAREAIDGSIAPVGVFGRRDRYHRRPTPLLGRPARGCDLHRQHRRGAGHTRRLSPNNTPATKDGTLRRRIRRPWSHRSRSRRPHGRFRN